MGLLMDIFTYDERDSYDANFTRWYLMNSKEHREWGQKPYSLAVAVKVSESIYGSRKYKQLSLFGK